MCKFFGKVVLFIKEGLFLEEYYELGDVLFFSDVFGDIWVMKMELMLSKATSM